MTDTLGLTIEELQRAISDQNLCELGGTSWNLSMNLCEQLLATMRQKEKLLLLASESRDALHAALQYMEPSNTTGIYARNQVKAQIRRCELACSEYSVGEIKE